MIPVDYSNPIRSFIVLCHQRCLQCYIHSLCGGARNTAQHVITVKVLAFLTQKNKAGEMQSTINQLKHGKGRAVHDNGTRGVVKIAIQHEANSTSFRALTNTYSDCLSTENELFDDRTDRYQLPYFMMPC